MTARVVVTGMAGISPIGNDWASIRARLEQMKNGIVRMDGWDQYEDLNTRLAAPVTDFAMPGHYRRKELRSMGQQKRPYQLKKLAFGNDALLH